DSADQGNAVLEIRAGDEAALFAADILNMYERYAFLRKWKFERLSIFEESGAIKEATALISGKGVFGNLRYESGVHRVQRVPITDKSESDLRIDYYRASGKGGQHVNKTSSANKAKALQILRARLYDMERNKLHQERSEKRRQQKRLGHIILLR
ncbi:846_t:CDS:2, partial [Racocetra fulgida]